MADLVSNFQLWIPISTLPLTIPKKIIIIKIHLAPKNRKKKRGNAIENNGFRIQMHKFKHVLITISNLEESLFYKQVRMGKG